MQFGQLVSKQKLLQHSLKAEPLDMFLSILQRTHFSQLFGCITRPDNIPHEE